MLTQNLLLEQIFSLENGVRSRMNLRLRAHSQCLPCQVVSGNQSATYSYRFCRIGPMPVMTSTLLALQRTRSHAEMELTVALQTLSAPTNFSTIIALFILLHLKSSPSAVSLVLLLVSSVGSAHLQQQMTISGDIIGTTRKQSLPPQSSFDCEQNCLFHQKAARFDSTGTLRIYEQRMRFGILHANLMKRYLPHGGSKRSTLWILCASLFLLGVADGWKQMLSREPRISGESYKELVSSLESVSKVSLKRPPAIATLLPARHFDGRRRYAPTDYLKPFVFTAVGIPAEIPVTNKSQTLLFLYSQGTVAWTGSDNGCSHMDVTSCLVGNDRFPIIFDANGVYTCPVKRDILPGERLSLVVSPSAWKKQPAAEQNKIILRYLASMPQLDDGSFAIDSDVIWNGQMERVTGHDEGRYKVCLMTQEKVFTEYIPEWIAYHRRIGVDYVYIYDNQSPTNLSEMYKDAPDVEVVHWPWQRSQIQAQNHFLLVGRRRCEWAVMIDVDEYIMIRPAESEDKEQPLKRYLRIQREKHDFSQIRLVSVALGSSGYIYRPREPVAEAYWHSANIQDNLTKPVVWLGHTLPDSFVHHVTMAPAYYSHTTKSALDHPETVEIALCHMKYRSWEDYVRKGRGGRNSFHVDEWEYSSSWSVHSPSKNHITIRNADTFVEFRKLWRRLMTSDVRPSELGPPDGVKERYKRVTRPGFVWKRRRGLENSTLHRAIVEEEKCFRELKDWEVAKRDRLARMGIEVEF